MPQNMPIADVDTYDLDISAEQAAKKIGCIVVKPEPNQLQLDIDTGEAYARFKHRIVEFERHSKYIVYIEEHISKSGYPRRHITLSLTDLEDNPVVLGEYERIALQAVLGSDIVRETLNTWRLLRGSTNPSRLFEPKDMR